MLLGKENTQHHIPIQLIKADTFSKRFLGLMFKRSPIKDEALMLSPCNSIHMFFMNFPIDVAFLNKQNQVVKVVENLRPWRVLLPVTSAHTTIELPSGAIKTYNIEVGDQLFKDEQTKHTS